MNNKFNDEKYTSLSPVYGNKLSNHAPMFMHALRYLGMDENSILKTADDYIENRGLQRASGKKTKIVNIHDFLGSREHYLDYVEFFENEIEENGSEETIKKYIDLLLEGSSADAFHGLIRLAYATESGIEGELARTLAYMSDSYYNFKFDLIKIPINEPFETFIRLSNSKHFKDKEFKVGLISDRMIEISKDKEVEGLLANLDEQYINIKSLSEIVLRLYSMTYNFTVLHALTSTHALSILMPYIKDSKRFIKLHWIHIQLAYLSTNCTELKDINLDTNTTWDEVFNKAIGSDDIHTHKLIYSLHKMYLKYKDEEWSPLYLSCAKKHLNM